MPDFEGMYFRLMAAVADAVEALEQMDFGQARDILVCAQQDAEEGYLAETP